MAATSVKKEHKLPDVALDLLRLALKEDKFPQFWKEVIEQGLLKKPSWPARCVCSTQLRSMPTPYLGGTCPVVCSRKGSSDQALFLLATCVSACWVQPFPCCPKKICNW
jgi:hypothetical protein